MAKLYTDIFNIKDMYMKDIAPKYFDVKDINTLNVGLYGQVNEILASTTEDVFNTISTYTNELIPNRASMPASIYGYAAYCKVDNYFAKCAAVDAVIYVNIDYIISSKTRSGDKYIFNLDKNMEIYVEDKLFMLDYDISVIAKPYRDKYIFNARYVINGKNSISDIKNPYIKSAEIDYSGSRYIALVVRLHQGVRRIQTDNIINNSIINAPVITFKFDDEQLAGFNVYYVEPGKTEEKQLIVLQQNSSPVKEPFCYYAFKNDSEIAITFSTKEFAFRPEINSDVIIEYFITEGVKGTFEEYSGDNITCVPKSDKWDYNNNMIIFCTIEGPSRYGVNMPSLNRIKSAYIEKMTTVDSYTTEEDLNQRFKTFNFDNNTNTRFLKTRDDFYRQFTGYSLFKDKHGEVYPTNTLSTTLKPTDFDNSATASILIMKPGKLYVYDGASRTDVKINKNFKLKDDYSSLTDEFIYTSPYLMMVTKSPNSIGYYLNSIDKTILTDYEYVNGESVIQFICNSMDIFRDSYNDSDKYRIRVKLVSATDLDEDIFDVATGADKNVVKAKFIISDAESNRICYYDFKVVGYEKERRTIELEAFVETDDSMTLGRKFKVIGTKSYTTNEVKDFLIDIVDCRAEIAVFYKQASGNISHGLPIDGVSGFTLTNIYETGDNKIDWIKPVSMINSTMKFIETGTGPNDYVINISHMPLIKADVLKSPEMSRDLLNKLYDHQDFINEATKKITNNYSVDIKFYNTYGRSKNLTIGEEQNQLLDKVNLSIHFDIRPAVGAPIGDLTRDLKIFIKEFIQRTNESIFNSFHVSNLIRAIEVAFPDVSYLTFRNINNYPTLLQTITPKYIELENMPKDEKIEFVPEYMSIRLDDIKLTMLT